MPASHRAASCTANVPFPLRPRTFPPLQCPPLPGPTRPPAPLCERRLLPDLASSSVLSPAQKICRGDPKNTFRGCGLVCLFTIVLLSYATLAVAARNGREWDENWIESRYNRKAKTLFTFKTPLRQNLCFKTCQGSENPHRDIWNSAINGPNVPPMRLQMS